MVVVSCTYSGDVGSLPNYTRPGDAGIDLRTQENIELAPFERVCVGTGLSVELPEGYAALVMPRSGLALKHGVSLVNTPGLIDSNYRGEIKVILINLDAHEVFHAEKGDRIAQLVIIKVEETKLMQVSALTTTQRGESGFGSSGVN